MDQRGQVPKSGYKPLEKAVTQLTNQNVSAGGNILSVKNIHRVGTITGSECIIVIIYDELHIYTKYIYHRVKYECIILHSDSIV